MFFKKLSCLCNFCVCYPFSKVIIKSLGEFRLISIKFNYSLDGQDFSSLVKNKKRKTLREWEAMGVRNPDGSLLPERNLTARIVPSSTSNLVFLAYSNFDSILRWNRSIYYAASVGRLSDALR